MKTFNTDEQAMSVSEAIFENGKFLPTGTKISLEYLDQGYDGIFPNLKSWKSFITGNFLDGNIFLSEVKSSTLKKWCHDKKEYCHLFAVNIGGNKFLSVESENISLKFDYEVYYNNQSNFPCSVEIFVIATIM